MSNSDIQISAIFTAHREGLLTGKSINSLLEAVDFAKGSGLNIEIILCLDNPDAITKEVIESHQSLGAILEFEFGDQGLVRNEAITQSNGKYIAFLDGDDLWSFNWLVEAHKLAQENEMFIVHPAYNWFFEGSHNILKKIDQRSPIFDKNFLRIGNYWDALCFCHRSVYDDCPYGVRDMDIGFAYEDWHWNCQTISANYTHVVAKKTIHFKRRRTNSQTMKASTRKVLMRDTKILHY